MDSETILKAVNSVTKDWTRRRKAEERYRRPRRTYYSSRVYFTDVADEILPKAYAHASGNGAYTLPKRNFYYAAREDFLQATKHEITYERFQAVLLRYMNEHPSVTASWKITADPRGNFEIPNCNKECRIPVGTIDIDNYLAEIAAATFDEIALEKLPIQWPSKAPGERFAALLYIEKEGFGPMLQEARIADRYDLAIISCKGQSVVAARKLVDRICHGGGVPLFVVHDFDKAGFEILQSLTTVSAAARLDNRVAYHFQNRINVTDFGLRLTDAQEYGLASETVNFKGNLPPGLSGAEREFLQSGQRVELNAFTCDQFIQWLENKLDEHLPDRLIPADDILGAAFMRAHAVASINRVIKSATDEAKAKAEQLDIPEDLRDQVAAAVEDTAEPWDKAIYKIAEECHDEDIS